MSSELNFSQLIERAKAQTSSTELAELLVNVAALADGEDPVVFLLKKIDRERELREQYADYVHEWNTVVAAMFADPQLKTAIGFFIKSGDTIADGLRKFLVYFAEHRRDELARFLNYLSKNVPLEGID